MGVSRIAGFVTLGVVLLGIGLLGAPPGLLALLAGTIAATAFLPRGVGAQAASNLAQKLYNHDAWHVDWSRAYLAEADRDTGSRGRARRPPELDVPPALLPDDLQESKAWLRTLAAIRGLPEHEESGRSRVMMSACGSRRRRGGPAGRGAMVNAVMPRPQGEA